MKNIPNLRKYVADKNRWAAMFKKPKIELAFLTNAQKKYLTDCLEGDLSPENLCCDGELPRAQVKAKYAYLTKVQAELAFVQAV